MKITSAQYARAWWDALHGATDDTWDAISRNFLAYLREHGEMKKIAEIQRRIQLLDQQQRGVISVCVRSAHHLNEETLNRVLTQVMGNAHVEITSILDPNLIGGVRIETENRRWDISLQGGINQLKKTLM